jgi:hypothetical protein
MSAMHLDDVLQRLERLERQIRWWKRAVVALVVAAGASVLVAANDKAAKALDVTSLTFRDDKGYAVGTIRPTSHGFALVRANSEGKPWSGLAIGRDAAALYYFDDDGKPISGVAVDREGVAIGYRTRNNNMLVGQNAVRDVIGPALRDPGLWKPDGKK